ncbi:kinesin-like protein KIN-6 isoform X3 [Durio zibethinus]|uniref:Kinesin-like protein KIN-6 isoform X3 n=1 Tax=Durio zibethinus TaxID=66656 RepID=A0A6P6AWG6_DURZI|nr:kinesin-like protein KIN-6 isoform X3 [Durio zibethinus]
MRETEAMETKSPSTLTIRRNPYRKARATPLTVSSRLPSHSTSSSKLPQISSFPIHDILSEEIPPNPPPTVAAASPSRSQDMISENLKVYLRIRPLVPLKSSTKIVGDQNPRSRPKNVWPQVSSKKNSVKEKKISKKKSNESCIMVSDDFHSVTLSPPLPLQETKRIKSEVYEGFSHVFSTESTQTEVYEKMVNPLVEDFLRGKSGMLAALGPTGSGKTHTVFGSPREPGMVPLALQRIFKPDQEWRFYLSIFEICTERGKSERISDLTSDGPDLSMQQSAIKGLQEVIVNDVAEAELLIARALLKRSTAMTNSNSQSSRSQCIINIRRGTNRSDAETDEQSNSAILSIVDLAGAEREKRTGNQSLLEHQKNPKKALQKHFQNSLLTRYLRDYLEGKKRMTLILTVKSGEEDYLDTSYLLRQASPYMKIKFTTIEAQPNLLCNKRQFQTLSRTEQPKRMKLGNPDASMIEGKIVGDENQLPNEGNLTHCSADLKNSRPQNMNSDDLMKRERTHQITQSFAKALWSVLKQHNEKLKVAESENQILRENLRNEKKRSSEMQKELKNLRSCCTCSKGNSVASIVVKVAENFESMLHLGGQTSCGIDETKLDFDSSYHIKSECSSSPRILDSTPGEDQTNVKVYSPDCKCSPEKGKHFPRQQQDICSQVISHNTSSNLSGLECFDDKQEPEAMDGFDFLDGQVRGSEEVASSQSICFSNDNCQSCQILESFAGAGNIQDNSSESNYAVTEHLDPNSDVPGFAVSNLGNDSGTSKLPGQQLGENDEDSLDPVVSTKDVEHSQQQDAVDVPESEIRPDTSCNSLKKEKPKRRLLPASSILVREISTFDADELDKPRGNGGVKNLDAPERQRTQGSISLLRLLKSNLHSLV